MTESRYDKIKRIYLAAVALHGEARDRFLDKAVGDDLSLRVEVEELLAYDADERSPAEAARGDATQLVGTAKMTSGLPEVIGGYMIRRRIGEGGMGAVYLAEQDAPKRTVALKVLRSILADPLARRRFEIEADLLGRLQHPAIAQVIESGLDENHGPFIIMEFIEGQTLDEWWRDIQPSQKEVLDLWARICDGVQHAHQRGVLHRDLKPGNILIDRAGDPKILDFGIGRLIDEDDRSTSSRTRAGEIVGTLAFLSPEQASGDPSRVDTRSDVYALGVMGYMGLLGRLPHEISGLSFPEALGKILNGEIERPSRVDESLPNDLETVVMKALDNDRELRYASAAELAADIRRFLAKEPVAAHPPSTWYQVRKFAGRHRVAVTSIIAAIILLIVSVIAISIFAVDADRSSKRATKEADRANTAAALAATQAERAERARYAAQIRAATAAVEGARAEEARRLLDEVDVQRRGWEWHHLCARLDTCDRLFGDRVPILGSAGFLNDGRIVVCEANGRLKVLDQSGGTVEQVIEVDTDVTCIATSQVNAEIATGHRDGKVKLWSLETKTLGRVFDSGDASVDRVLFSPLTGKILVSGGRAGKIWDPILGETVDTNAFKSAAWAADESHWLSGKGVRYSAKTGLADGRIVADEKLTSVALAKEDGEAVFGSPHPSLRVVDLTKETTVRYWRGAYRPITAVACDPQSRIVVSGDVSGAIQVWSREQDRPLTVLCGHEQPIKFVAVSPDGQRILAGTKNRVRLWQWRDSGAIVGRGHESYVYRAGFSPDGRLIASAAWDGRLRLWDGLTLEPLGVLASGLPGPTALAWFKDGRKVQVRGHGRRTFDLATGKKIDIGGTLAEKAALIAWPGRSHQCSQLGVNHHYFAKGRRTVVVESFDGKRKVEFPTLDRPHRIAIDRRETRLAVASGNQVEVFNLITHQRVAILRGHAAGVTALRFSYDGQRLATGGQDRSVRLWDTEIWTEVLALRGHDGDVRAVVFSPDDERLVSASADGTLRLWSSRPRYELLRDRDQAGEVLATGARMDELRRVLNEVTSARTKKRPDEIRGEAGSRFGEALAVSVNSSPAAPGTLMIGIARAAPGQTGGVELISLVDGRRLWRKEGKGRSHQFGKSVACVGDLNGDGTDDFAIGAPGFDLDENENVGAVSVLSGADGEMLGQAVGGRPGSAWGRQVLAAGDLNGDGSDDLWVVGNQEIVALSLPSLSPLYVFKRSAQTRQGDRILRIPDCDDDGVEDLAVAESRRSVIRILSGADARELRVIPVQIEGRLTGFLPLLQLGDLTGFAYRSKINPRTGHGFAGSIGDMSPSWSRRLRKPRSRELFQTVEDFDRDGHADIAAGVDGRSRDSIDQAGSVRILSGRDGAELFRIDGPAACRSFGTVIAETESLWIIGSPWASPPRVTLVPKTENSEK